MIKHNQRVMVWSGDQKTCLGPGTHVEDVTVFYVITPDGTIRSYPNAEIEPDPSDVCENCEVIVGEANPKIVLDSGQTVYGCQVWWRPMAKGGA